MVYNCVTCLDMLIKAGYNMVDTYQVGYDLTNTRFEKEEEGDVVVYTGSSAGSTGIVMYCTIYGGDSWVNVASTYSTGDIAIYENVETGKFLEIYTRKVNRCYLTCSLRNPQTNIWHSACSFDEDRNAYRFNGLHTSTLARILCNGKNNDQILMELNKVELKSALEKHDG